ncbi:ABC transporter substrate-binding protein [Candidatus Bipolaricaulota bacterium]|nr:ABC transporter substrate-binding protein [Candidatus Bipolaricaulota bacterium]
MKRLTNILGITAVLLAISLACVAYPVIVVDDRGQEIGIESSPQRIVSLNALYTQIIVDLGMADRLIAVGESEDNPAEVADLPSVGPAFSPNVELILGHEPDLVLGANDWGGERPALEAANVTVFTTPWFTDVLSMFDTVRAIAATLDASVAGDLMIGRIAVDILETESMALGKQRVVTAFLYATTDQDPPYAVGAESIEHELILRAGGQNAFSDLIWSSQVSFEEILARDPEVIFTAPSQVENILGNTFLQSVSAVANGRVVGIRASDVASTRIADALRAMIAGLHDVNE